jgi:hypothetical protein
MSNTRPGIQRMGRDVHAAGLDLGHIQQVVDQGEKMRARGMDVLGIVAIALRTDRPEAFLGDDFRKTQNGVQGRAQFVAHIGQEGGLGGVGGFRLEALLQGFVAGFLELAGQILDLETQAGVLAHAQDQRAAGVPHLEGDEGRQTAHHHVGDRIAQQEPRRGHQGQRQEIGDIHFHVAAARHHQAGDHRHHASGQEHMIEGIARFPAQPGHQAPSGASHGLDADETLQPGIGVAFAVIVFFIGRRHQGRGAHRGGHRQGQEQGVSETDIAENSGGAENGGGGGPNRRGHAGIARRGGGQRQLRL